MISCTLIAQVHVAVCAKLHDVDTFFVLGFFICGFVIFSISMASRFSMADLIAALIKLVGSLASLFAANSNLAYSASVLNGMFIALYGLFLMPHASVSHIRHKPEAYSQFQTQIQLSGSCAAPSRPFHSARMI